MNRITKSDLLELHVMRIKKSKAVALDTETAGLNPHRDSLLLIQIYDQGGASTTL
jgi:ribonuclease D